MGSQDCKEDNTNQTNLKDFMIQSTQTYFNQSRTRHAKFLPGKSKHTFKQETQTCVIL